jgi:Domain of unknown function (DUF4160)
VPVLKDFGGFQISMYFQDENPPHVHVECANYTAKVSIRGAIVLKGQIDRKFRKQALEWIVENRVMLEAKWTEFKK